MRGPDHEEQPYETAQTNARRSPMILRKILVAAAAATLMSTPAWALPTRSPSNQGTANAPSATPNNSDNPGSANRHSGKGNHFGTGNNPGKDNHSGTDGNSGNPHGNGNANSPGKSHKCVPHKVAYTAGGTLVSQTLTKDSGANTYSGEVVVEVTRTNRHAAADKGKTVTYKVTNVNLTFGLADTNNDGTVGLDDLAKGDRVRLIGKITALAKKCSQTGFTAATTIRRIVFHAPAGTPEGTKA
jgi:hypothetical protein